MNEATGPSSIDGAPGRPALRRVLGTPMLVLYGLGVIIGAGIYVLVGTIVATAGGAAPWAFVLAGILAAMTGLSYAELAVRFPEAAGAAAYVKEAFGSDRLSRLTGLAVAAVVIVSTASIARGSAGYLHAFTLLPDAVIAGGLVALFTAVACLGCELSGGRVRGCAKPAKSHARQSWTERAALCGIGGSEMFIAR